MKVPGMGNGNFILLFKPEDARAMYAQDDRIPKIPGRRISLIFFSEIFLKPRLFCFCTFKRNNLKTQISGDCWTFKQQG